MCSQTMILINCVGPYRYYGEEIIKQCLDTNTHHIDFSGEPEYLETIQLKYNEEAKSKKLFIKLLSVSAATAITLRFFYLESFAANKSDSSSSSLSGFNEEKLISVHMFSRHGARTPLHLIKGLEEVYIFIYK